VTGIAAQAELGSSGIFPRTATSTAEAVAAPVASGYLREGDVMLIELQRNGPTTAACICQTACTRYVPEELTPASFDAIATATAHGVVVVAAAGNGSVNLDDPAYAGAFNRAARDSGALLVAARMSNIEEPQCFSNAGSRVDLHAWGDSVTTTGYGDLYVGALNPNDAYTSGFSGTSSASAIAAGAVTSLQGHVRAAFGITLSPEEMRSLLTETGTAQTGSFERPIGVQPDLRAAIGRLRGDAVAWIETFEFGMQRFTSVAGTDLPWTRYFGPTPTSSTGPNGDHTSGDGPYVYVESSGSGVGYPNKTAILQSACLDLRGFAAGSWTFYYHMLGSQMGRLIAEVDTGCDGGTMTPLFEQIGARTGTETNGYVRQQLNLAPFLGTSVRLRLRAVTGSGPLSDIAVDDIGVTLTRALACTSDAQCQAPRRCIEQRCVECRSDVDCAGGFCADGTCAECAFSAHCPDDGLFCTQAVCSEQHACVTEPTPCGSQLCSETQARCVQCLDNAHCPPGMTCNAQSTCVAPPCIQFATTTQQHVDAGRATTVRVSSRVEARLVGSNQLLESRSWFGRFSTTIRTVRTRGTLPGYEIGSCP
jgi:hypothetical protein